MTIYSIYMESKNKKPNCNCSVPVSYPSGCSKLPSNQITKIRIYENGNCYDQNGNYLGKFLKQTNNNNGNKF